MNEFFVFQLANCVLDYIALHTDELLDFINVLLVKQLPSISRLLLKLSG